MSVTDIDIVLYIISNIISIEYLYLLPLDMDLSYESK